MDIASYLTPYWVEQTGLTTSTDLLNWQRHEQNPIIHVTPDAWDSGFVSDPCVLKDGRRWVMFFFGYNYKAAQEGIAISENLLDWTKYPEPIITAGQEGELDSSFAHKPAVISHEGILYHFYTACRPPKEGDRTCNTWPEYRTITVAASRQLTNGTREEGR